MHTKIIFCLILIFIDIVAYSKDISIQVVDNYINQLVKNGSNILNDKKLTQDVKIAKARAFILANLDLNWMAQYTLGHYKKTLTAQQINQFIEIYAKYVSKSYTNLIRNFSNKKMKVKQILLLDEGEFMVEMTIFNNQGQPSIKISYLVHQVQEPYYQYNLKICDIITEGISLINSHQSEFNNIISLYGFERLIVELNKKS